MSHTGSQTPAVATPAEPAPTQPTGSSPFELMLDLKCGVTVLLGTATITVRDCLELRPSTVVALRETAGEDLRIQANGVDVARGEVVVVEDTTSIRVNEVVALAGAVLP